MDANQYARAHELFVAAMERPAAERAAYLEKACGGDHVLSSYVCSLLDADSTRGAEPVADAVAEAALGAISGDGLDEGAIVGSYRLVREIGAGGMGVVYLARRADGQFEQKVALKLVRAGIASQTAVARFHEERRILARLDHPGIARLLDGGVTDRGQPYFTMEYVAGQPIDEYCTRRRLDIRARLSLFRKVVEAVECAQRQLIVHRDLKPSNILVTESGDVKLLDFGIAKVLEPSHAVGGLTQTGATPLTPQYASPEQLLGHRVVPASDCYQLGLVLYELLAGRPPYDVADCTPVDLLVRVCERPPPLASRRGAEGNAASEATPPVTPRRLARALAGDLDAICARALRKDPNHRYPSASDFLADIDRYLDGRAVAARGGATLYRWRRRVTRHWRGIALAAGIGAASTIAAASYVANISEARERAERQAAKAEQVSSFLLNLFSQASPESSPASSELTVGELLDRGHEALETELAQEPQLRATALITVAEIYSKLGRLDASEKAARQAVELLDSLHQDRDDENLANGLRVLADTLLLAGAPNKALPLVERAVRIQTDLGASDEIIALSEILLASIQQTLGNASKSQRVYQSAIDRLNRSGATDSNLAMVVFNDYGLLLSELDRFREAEDAFAKAIAIGDRLGAEYGMTSPLYNRGELIGFRFRFDEGEQHLLSVRRIERKLLAPDHPNVAYTTGALGRLYMNKGDYARAERLLRESLELRRELHGDENPNVAQSLSALASLHLLQGRYDEARRLADESLATMRRINGDSYWATPNLVQLLARLSTRSGDHVRALKMHQREQQLRLASHGEGHVRTLLSEAYLARAYARAGKADEARRLRDAAVAAFVGTSRESSFLTLWFWQVGADVAAHIDPPAAALAAARKALEQVEAARLPANHPARGRALLAVGRALGANDRRTEAQKYLDDALALYEGALGRQHPLYLETLATATAGRR